MNKTSNVTTSYMLINIPDTHFKVRKINSNNRLYGFMTYQVVVNSFETFVKIRSWCFQTFGESLEYQLYVNNIKHLRNQIPVWSWDSGENGRRHKRHIYFQSDNELNLFKQINFS